MHDKWVVSVTFPGGSDTSAGRTSAALSGDYNVQSYFLDVTPNNLIPYTINSHHFT